MLELFGRSASINVRKVLWLLDELALEFVHHGGDGGLDPQALRVLNPNAMVPVLRRDGFVLWESNAICRYLAAAEHRHDLLPAGPRERARVEQWMDWQATELNNAWRYAFMAKVRLSPAHADPDAIATSVAQWNQHMRILEAQLGHGQRFVLGAQFTLADIVLGLSVQRWLASPIQRPALPAVQAYYASLRERPAYLRHGANGTP